MFAGVSARLEFADLARQRKLFVNYPRARRRLWLAGLVFIPLWQATLFYSRHDVDLNYTNRASAGANWEPQFYFFYHTGLFPVCTRFETAGGGAEEVQRIMKEKGSQLTTVVKVDRLPVLLYFVDAWSGGDPHKARLIPANALFFTLALMLFFSACMWARREVLGSIVTLLVGSNPFQVFETYLSNNVFCWPITIGLAAMALTIPFLDAAARPRWVLLAAPFLAGLVLGSGRHLRGEAFPIVATVGLAFLLVPRQRWFVRLALPVLLVLGINLSMHGWTWYFNWKHAQAAETVAKLGGETPDPEVIFHPHWHPIFCGLGDFDDRYGYLWDDRVAYEYYHAKVYEQRKRYDTILKNKIYADVQSDPLWFLSILFKRVWRILGENTPARITVGGAWFELPVPVSAMPFVFAFVLFVTAIRRRFDLVKFLLLPASLAATALIVFSGGGVQYYSIVHLFAVALFLAMIIELILAWRGIAPPDAAPPDVQGAEEPLVQAKPADRTAAARAICLC